MRALTLLLALSACGSESLSYEHSNPPIDTGDSGAEFIYDLDYGELERQQLDVLHFPDALEPTPVVVYLHGGGFVQGDKSEAWQGELAPPLLNAEVAVVSVRYRLLAEVDAEGVIKPLSDCARAVQFLRHHSEQLNIDPERIAVSGVSAGAGASLWLASHDDMADKRAKDPVLRASSRVSGAAVWETQATYDIPRWTTDVFEPFGLDLFQTAKAMGLEQTLLSFYGITDAADLESPEILAYRADVDMLALQSPDDAPLWVRNSMIPPSFPLSVNALFHHPYHADQIRLAADAQGVEHTVFIPQLEVEPASNETAEDFLLRVLNK